MTGTRSGNNIAKKAKSKNLSRVPFGERQFMSWDGEGGDGKYWLFGCSDGSFVQADGLRTVECLALLMRKATEYPDRINIAYGFNYDVTMITVDFPDQKLVQLKETGHCSWGRWHFEWMPKKWFRVYDWKHKTGIRIFDGMTFFQTSFVKACEMVLGAEDERLDLVRSGKANRSDFKYGDIDEIRSYMFGELSLSDDLFSRLREHFATAGIHPRGWYGPGAVASALLTRERVREHMDAGLPDGVSRASALAYFGGRFESYYTGRYKGPIFSYDIRSAYPHALRLLPSLSAGHFEHVANPGDNLRDFALYSVQYDFDGPSSAKLGFPHPFPYRDKQNRVFYPPHVSGWYWGVEVKAAMQVFGKAISVDEGWEFVQTPHDSQDPCQVPPFGFVQDLYEQRAAWKREGNGAQLAAKLALNSLYGKLAQRVGWDQEKRTPPRWHQLEWAGFITAVCRSMIYTAMMQAPADIIAVETDGIYSRVPLDLELGQGLGQWEQEIYDELIYVQSGVYWTVKNGTVHKAKVRGFGSGSFAYEDAASNVASLVPLTGQTHRFGAISGYIGKPELRQWMDTDRTAIWGGGGKRAHADQLCHKCAGRTDIQLHNLVVTNFRGGESHPHFLPWKAAVGEINEYQEMSDDDRFTVVRV